MRGFGWEGVFLVLIEMKHHLTLLQGKLNAFNCLYWLNKIHYSIWHHLDHIDHSPSKVFNVGKSCVLVRPQHLCYWLIFLDQGRHLDELRLLLLGVWILGFTGGRDTCFLLFCQHYGFCIDLICLKDLFCGFSYCELFFVDNICTCRHY